VRDPRQALRLGERQRAQQQRVDDAEYGRAGADAQAGDQYGEGGEPRVAAKRAESVAEVVGKRGHDALTAHGAAGLASAERVSATSELWSGEIDSIISWCPTSPSLHRSNRCSPRWLRRFLPPPVSFSSPSG